MQRPDRFTLNGSHPLYTGLQFFGGGEMAGSSRYVDSSLYGIDGALLNYSSNQWSKHLGRPALSVNGSNQAAYMGTGNPALAIAGEMTMAFWHLPQNNTAFNSLLWNINSTGANGYWGLEFGGATNYRYRFWAGGYFGVSNTDVTDTSSWVHVAAVKTGSSGDWTVTYYVNGESHGTGTSTTNANGSVVTAGAAIGRLGALPSLYATARFADTAIWNRALTLPEIQVQASGDPMIGGLILPPARKWWPVSGGVPSGALTGSIAITTTASGTLTGSGSLSGSTALEATASGTLSGAGALSGSSALSTTASGELTGTGALTGSTALATTATGTLTGTGALAGSSALQLTASGTLTSPAGALTGTAAMQLTASGTLTGAGTLSGAVAMVLGCTGVVVDADSVATPAKYYALDGPRASRYSLAGPSTQKYTLTGPQAARHSLS